MQDRRTNRNSRNRHTRVWRIATLVAALALAGAGWLSAQTASVSICGPVTAYVAPTASLAGVIVIGGQTIPIAAGANIDGSGLINVGADVCLTGALNVSGQLTAPASVRLDASASVHICGVVTAYTAATALLPGSITIGGQTIPIAIATVIDAAGLITAGANLCLDGTLNGLAQLTMPSSVTANATASVHVCGVVSAYTAATASSAGSITIGGQTIPIAAGTTIDGAGLITLGADLCLNGTLNGSGQLVVPSSVSAAATTSVTVCGVVSAYTSATASSPGSITIGGQSIPIAAGTTIGGAGRITLGTDLCLNGTLNASGELVVPSSVTAGATTSINLCGTVTAYTAATANSAGSITIGGQTLPIAAGTALDGAGLITAGANLCLNGSLNAAGQLVLPTSVSAGVSSRVSICGVVSAFTAATASAPGSISIGGQVLPIAAGTALGGSRRVNVGANVCLDGTLDLSGQLVPPSVVTVNVSGNVDVCGVVSAFTPATATAPGSITIGGQSYTIAAGASLGFPVTIGQTTCANLLISPGNPGGGDGGGGSSGGGEIVGGSGQAAAREIVFPVAAHLVGRGGAFWETDLRILNLGASPATVTIEWYPFSVAGRSGPTMSVAVIVNPGAQGVYDQTLSSLFDTEGGGSLRLVSSSSSVGAALRLFHDGQEGACDGTFGMFEKGLLASEVVPRGALLVLGNRPDDPEHLRTNVGYFNASPSPSSLTFRAFATDGRLLGTKTLTVPGFANDQRSLFALIDSVSGADRSQQDLYVTFESQGGMPFVYGAAVFNSTNDALYVAPWQY